MRALVFSVLVLLLLTCLVLGASASAQQQQPLPDSPKPQADRPAFPAPNPSVPSRQIPPSGTGPDAQPAPSQQDPNENPATPPPAPASEPAGAPSPNVKTVPPGSSSRAGSAALDELPTYTKSVNFVLVPVTVKDDSGHIVDGLTENNFSIYENGEKQRVRFFTSDPFAISAALVIDVGMPEVALQKIKNTYPAWLGAFSQYDEVSVYTYGNTVKQWQDFVGAQSDKLVTAFKHVESIRGRNTGPSIPDSPMTAGPSVNGRPSDPGRPLPSTSPRNTDEPSHSLNDAILRAALDLGKRDRSRRKMIFIVSDGREQGSTASYSDVLKVLLSNEVAVYAIAVDAAALPGYSRLGRIRIPTQGYSNILPKYTSATGGGQPFSELSQDSIERAYAAVTSQARNQYTIGYTSPAAVAGGYRSIEVRVNRAGLRVYARDGYYPAPPARRDTGATR